MEMADVFSSIAYKELVQVDLPKRDSNEPDLPKRGSNQHEINGTAALRKFFRTSEKVAGSIKWFYFADDRETLNSDGEFTFYDARAKSAERTGRTEWHLYYKGDFLNNAEIGDLFVLAKTHQNEIYGLVFQKDSGWFRAASVLFEVAAPRKQLVLIPDETLQKQTIEYTKRRILEELQLDIVIPSAERDRQLVIDRFNHTFPSTKEMSQFAREHTEVDPNNWDATLIKWLNREEELFFALEQVIVGERLIRGFHSVDEFVQYSLSVHNRRKSRMGYSLEHQLAALFDANHIRYDRQVRTEGKNKPDFIFPGKPEYHDPQFDSSLLVMLGSKSTLKERWRQILTEANRIPHKHLCTLETGISTAQTNEMQLKQVTLVIPLELHSTFTAEQQNTILSVDDFLDFLRFKQQQLQ